VSTDINEQRKALREAALHFHEFPKPGKLEIQPLKPLGNQRDLALAYSPGVAAPCEEIAQNPETVARYTSRQNLVAVISNGTAVLGLGNIGALASKPVMEGKAVLFKKFAGIDVFDLEIDEINPQKFIDAVAPLWPTFGGINLEDIRAPDCFEIEETLRERMPIPVFHDDQHGTAIIVGAAVLNGLELAGKKIDEVKICTSGAGAAAIACLNVLVALGAKHENIWVADKDGLVTHKRNDVNDKWRGQFRRTSGGRIPGSFRRWCAEAGNAGQDGPSAADPGAGQSEPGNHAGSGQGGPAGRHGLHRAFGLSQPGQQRPLLPLYLPWRARRACDDDQRGNEAGGSARHCQARA
jgi:malate dehydrogenase (oxaloacetate-decarboxylating)(NADP+)